MPSLSSDIRESFSSGPSIEDFPRHRWYWIKESFTPRLVESAIATTLGSSKGVVIDPFAGAGTVPLHASILGHRSWATDVNPFLAFVAATKVVSALPAEVEAGKRQVLEGINRGGDSKLMTYSTFCRASDESKGLFNYDVLSAHEGGRRAMREIASPSVRRLVRLALIGATMDCCNAVRDGKALRYRRSLLDSQFGKADFIDAFERRIAIIESDLGQLDIKDPLPIIRCLDARAASGHVFSEAFDLCVTSPPYLNSFDYSDVYRPELFVGGFVTNNEQLRRVRRRTLRSHVQTTWERPKKSDFGIQFRSVHRELMDRQDRLWDKRLPTMVQAYFEDMDRVFRSIRKKAKPSAWMWLVVSTSAYGGVQIPVDLILAEVGGRAGWYLRDMVVLRQMRSAGQQWGTLASRDSAENGAQPLRESLLTFCAAPIK